MLGETLDIPGKFDSWYCARAPHFGLGAGLEELIAANRRRARPPPCEAGPARQLVLPIDQLGDAEKEGERKPSAITWCSQRQDLGWGYRSAATDGIVAPTSKIFSFGATNQEPDAC